jgi:hypothetical protein
MCFIKRKLGSRMRFTRLIVDYHPRSVVSLGRSKGVLKRTVSLWIVEQIAALCNLAASNDLSKRTHSRC